MQPSLPFIEMVKRLKDKLGNVILKAGDVLLLFAGENFISRTKDTHDFYFISKVSEFVKLEWYKSLILDWRHCPCHHPGGFQYYFTFHGTDHHDPDFDDI